MVVSMDRWVGKVAVVTGASAGIGAAIAEQLVEHGMQVVGLARRLERLQELSKKLSGKKGKLHPLKADVTVESDIKDAFEWVQKNLGGVHVLVNNAGILQDTTLIGGDTQKWKKVFDTNVLGLCIATREAIEIMKKEKIEGHVIHINSVAGHHVPNFAGLNVYSASKFAVTALTETLRNELNAAGLKIRITSISPGYVKTEIIDAFVKHLTEDLKKFMESSPSLKAEDIADAVVYALSTPPHVQVVGLARRIERVQALAKKLSGKKGKLHPFKADVTVENDIKGAFEWTKKTLGAVHVLVNNAGIIQENTLIGGDTEKWKKILDTNVVGLCIATREAIEIMKQNKIDGHIIHINSVAGHTIPNFPGLNIYPASKHAVTALTETLRHEINAAGLKIKITSISPGYVKTEINVVNIKTQTAEMKKFMDAAPALESEDVADAVVYALSTPPHVQIHELIIKPVGEVF